MGPDWSSTARVQRGPSETARCASTEDHQAPSSPLFREHEDDQAASPLQSAEEGVPREAQERKAAHFLFLDCGGSDGPNDLHC